MAPRVLHVWVLWAFAVAQPIYDAIRRNGEFFVAHEADRLDLILLTIALSLILPGLAAAAIWLLARVSDRAGAAAMLAAVALFGALIALQALRATGGMDTGISFAAAAVLGAGAAWLYGRAAPVRQFLTILSPAVLMFPVLFLASGGLRALMSPPAPPPDAAITAAPDTPIVFVVFDQLPLVSLLGANGHIDATAFPSFAALERDALWFRNATTVADLTGWALPALVSGEFPDQSKLPIAADHPRNLFTMLAATHAMEVVEPITKLCPESLCARAFDPRAARQAAMLSDLSIVYPHIFLPPDMAAALPPLTNNWRDFAADNRDWRRRWVRQRDRDRRVPPERFIDGIEEGDPQPTLYFLHALLPHEPYLYMRGGTQITEDTVLPGLRDGSWGEDQWTVAQAYRQHLLQVQYVDTILGKLIARLKSEGLYDRALLVVTSDHGASFRPGLPFKAVRGTTVPGIAAVPLFVKRPFSRAGELSDRNVQSVDVLPTIADLLGAEVPWRRSGVSAVGASDAPERKTIFHDGARNDTRLSPAFASRVSDFVAYKLSLFEPSTPGSTWRLADAPAPHLIDRPIRDLEVGARSTLRLRLMERWRFGAVDPSTGFVPARIMGQVLGRRGADTRWPLAVAVNGVVRETTWSAGSAVSPAGFWNAIVDPEAFTNGANAVEIYEIETRGDTTALRPALGAESRPAELNLLGADGIDWGVEDEGLYALESGPPPFRWTNGNARLAIDVDAATPPRALRIGIAPPAHRLPLTILVNGCTLFEGTLPGGAWERTFPLDACDRGLFDEGEAQIEIRSGGFTPPGGDTRTLGVPLSAVTLVVR